MQVKNELAVLSGKTKRMSTREIAELTGKEHNHVLRDVRNLIEQGAIGQSNFGQSSYRNIQNKEQPMYELDFDATMTLVTGYDAVLRAKVITRWRELETGEAAPLSGELLLAKAILYANDKIQKQQAQIEEMKPKALFADAVVASHTSILVGELAKLLKQNGVKIGQNRLFAILRQEGWLIKRGCSKNMPSQRSMEQSLFEIQERTISSANGSIHIIRTPKVTGKGQYFFVNLFLKKQDEGLLDDDERSKYSLGRQDED